MARLPLAFAMARRRRRVLAIQAACGVAPYGASSAEAHEEREVARTRAGRCGIQRREPGQVCRDLCEPARGRIVVCLWPGCAVRARLDHRAARLDERHVERALHLQYRDWQLLEQRPPHLARHAVAVRALPCLDGRRRDAEPRGELRRRQVRLFAPAPQFTRMFDERTATFFPGWILVFALCNHVFT